MRPAEIGKGILVLLFPLLIVAALGELTTRIYTRFAIIYDVEMSRYAMHMKVPSPDPKIGHVHKPDSSAQLMGVPVRINSAGFRDREYSVERNDAYRIVFLGDSLTFGWGVEQEASFADVLERELGQSRPIEIINFGTGNYNTEQQVNLFLDRGLQLEPDKVVVFYFINDAEVTPKQSKWRFLGHSRFITFVWSRVHAVLASLFSTSTFRDYYSGLYREDQPGWARAKEAFLQLREACRERGIALQVVLLPELHGLSPYLFEAEYRTVRTFLTENGIQHMDLAPFFANETEPQRLWVARDDAHPNAYAHALIAQYTKEFVAP